MDYNDVISVMFMAGLVGAAFGIVALPVVFYLCARAAAAGRLHGEYDFVRQVKKERES